MSEEEKKAIEYIKEFQKDLYGASSKNLMASYLDTIFNLIHNQQKEIVKLKDIIKTIRRELKGNVIVKDDNGYAPAKNLTKQEVYESYVKLITLLKANYVFKEDEEVIKELLEE